MISQRDSGSLTVRLISASLAGLSGLGVMDPAVRRPVQCRT